jgi:hypothetical protein
VVTNGLEERITSINPEDGGNTIQNVGNQLQDYTVTTKKNTVDK